MIYTSNILAVMAAYGALQSRIQQTGDQVSDKLAGRCEKGGMETIVSENNKSALINDQDFLFLFLVPHFRVRIFANYK